MEAELTVPGSLALDHIYSVFLQIEQSNREGSYESFVCAIRYDELAEEAPDANLEESTFKYSTCGEEKYSEISETGGNFKAYQSQSDDCPAAETFQLDFDKTKLVSQEEGSLVACSFSRLFEVEGLADIRPGAILSYRLGFNVYPSVIAERQTWAYSDDLTVLIPA